MKRIKEYKKVIFSVLILFITLNLIYYIAKSTLNIRLRVLLGLVLVIGLIGLARRFKDLFIGIKEKYGDIAARIIKEIVQKVNSLFIGLYGLGFILSADVSDYLSNFPFSEFSYMGVGLFRTFVELMIGFFFIISARLSFSRQKKFVKILYPLLVVTYFYLFMIGEGLISLLPLLVIGLMTYFTKEVLNKESFIYSIEEILIDFIFAAFYLTIYFKNTFTTRPLEAFPIVYKLLFFAIVFAIMLISLRLILSYMKADNEFLKVPDLDEYEKFLAEINQDTSITAGLGFLGDKYIHYYEEDGRKLLAFIYQVVNNKIIVMGEPIGREEYLDQGLRYFVDKCEESALKPVFYEVGRKFTMMLHDYGYDFMKFGENAFLDLEEFSLAGRKKSSLRNILNRFEKDGYKFELIDPPYDNKLLDRLEVISEKWLKGRDEKGFSMGFFDRSYLSRSKLALVYDKDMDLAAFISIMPNYDDKILTIDLMRYDTDMNVNSMMDYLFLNVFIYGKDKGYKYFNLGMAPLSNVGINKSAYLPEKIASLIFKHADFLYPFKGLRNYKSKYASIWDGKYISFAKGNFILTSISAILFADKGKIKED